MFSLVFSQESDSLNRRTPKKAAFYAFLFPGGGQLYNRKYLKAVILFGAEIYAGMKFNEYRIDYRNYKDGMEFQKQEYLVKRNKSAWWIGFIYIYGLIDAIVDAHLQSFDEIMSEDLEQLTEEDKKQKEGK